MEQLLLVIEASGAINGMNRWSVTNTAERMPDGRTDVKVEIVV